MRDTNAAYEQLKNLADDYHHYVSLRPKTDFVFDGSDALITLLSTWKLSAQRLWLINDRCRLSEGS